MPIQWDRLEPDGYEDMVSVLLSRLYRDAQRIDGKGGDGGRDVQIVGGEDDPIAHAFQLKSFTGRMDSGRREQVKRSLKRAAALEPARWTLVVPIDPTPKEIVWFRELGTKHSFPICWLGKTWLDDKMSEFPDIRRYFLEGAKDEVYNLLTELREEQARITEVHDAVARMRTLRERLNEIDPHYRYELSTGTTAADGTPAGVVLSVSFSDMRVDLYPKYLGATKDRPVSINVKVVFRPGDEEVQNALNYGLEVTIPPRMISSVTIDAPSGLGGNFTGGEVDVLSTSRRLDEIVTLTLDIMDGDRLLASCPIHLTEQTRGLKGSIIHGKDNSSWLETRLTVDGVAGKFTFDFRLAPRPILPTALVPLCRWLGTLQPPHDLRIRWPSGFEMRTGIHSPYLVDQSFGKVVQALAYLQDRSGIYWEMPSSISPDEGREILMAAALLKGESITLTWKSINLNLKQWGPGLEELLNGSLQDIIIEKDSWLELEGKTIPIGRVRTSLESARLADPEGVRHALKSGSVQCLRLVPGDTNKAERVVVS